MLTLLTRCPLASPPWVCASIWQCEGSCSCICCLSNLWLAWVSVCNCLFAVCVLCVCVAAVRPPPVCLQDNQPLPATTETEGTEQECLSLTNCWMPRRTHRCTHKTKNTHVCSIQVALLFIHVILFWIILPSSLQVYVQSLFGKFHFFRRNHLKNAFKAWSHQHLKQCHSKMFQLWTFRTKYGPLTNGKLCWRCWQKGVTKPKNGES